MTPAVARVDYKDMRSVQSPQWNALKLFLSAWDNFSIRILSTKFQGLFPVGMHFNQATQATWLASGAPQAVGVVDFDLVHSVIFFIH